MRTLHVAALPYPSPQGTQGLIHQMLSCLARAGHDTHLLCYAHGAAQTDEGAPPYHVHRIERRGFTRSLRSGPSLDKLWLDIALAQRLKTLRRELAPELVIAHHVEAALAACHAPFVFVAHTSLSAELPVYFAQPVAALAGPLGRQLDRLLIMRAQRSFAVSPLLAQRLSRESGLGVTALPLPWPVPAALEAHERHQARAALGLHTEDEVVLYAGNLDAYQGLDALLMGLSAAARQRPRLRFLLATEADGSRIEKLLQQSGLSSRTTFSPLHDEATRRRVHAAADLALIPRHSPGGVPMKLLDALARGIPVLAAERALAGLPLKPYCRVVDGDSASAWHDNIVDELSQPRNQRMADARAYVQRTHTDGAFAAALLAAQ